MKLGSIRFSAASLAVLVIQLALVCSIAGKYLYQRWTCPRVWTRTVAYDPELPMRGRYLSLQLTADGCQSTLPSAKHAEFPRDYNGAAVSGNFMVREEAELAFPAELKVVNNRLAVVYIRDTEKGRTGQSVIALRGSPCDQMRLAAPVNFYISEHAQIPLSLARGAELWIEVTVPPKGPPRPIQLAMKKDGAWQPLVSE